MKLNSFSYKEPGWQLVELAPLNSANLLVAKNATGKSRSVRAIQNVTSFLQMKETVMGARTFESELIFHSKDSKEWELKYMFKINNGVVEKEILTIGGKELIKRTKTSARYQGTKINPPSEKLVVQIRRDNTLYPEIEKLMLWAEGVMYVYCSDINPYTILGMGKLLNPYSFSDLVDSLSEKELKIVLKTAQSLGYNITRLTTVEAVKGIRLVKVQERSVTNEMIDMQLSNGMLRTLYLLCFASVIKHNNKLSMLLIDDLGEGLDYRRSVDLGKIIFKDCDDNGVQLLVSSNDAFLMDVVDIKYWQVLRRNNSKVTAINPKTHPDLFKEFRLTGLSNFDLFSSDFIDNYLNRE